MEGQGLSHTWERHRTDRLAGDCTETGHALREVRARDRWVTRRCAARGHLGSCAVVLPMGGGEFGSSKLEVNA